MKRTIAALALVGLFPGLALAQPKIVDIRPCYGANGAAEETKNPKLVPGDVLWIDFAIDNLQVDAKTHKVSYETKLEFLDSKGKQRFERKNQNEGVVQLGGVRMPGDLHILIGDAFPPGDYTIQLTVTDNHVKGGANSVTYTYPLQVVPLKLGFVHVEAPALGLPGLSSGVTCLVTGFELGPNKMCNVQVTIRVLDDKDQVVSLPSINEFPAAIPAPAPPVVKLLPVVYPISVLNRPGQFYIELVAVDRNAKNKEARLRLPLKVLDINAVTGK